jgi:hypothetical protein
VSWTFRSGHVPGTTPQRLPVSTVRFTPKLNADNAAKAGRAFTVPVTVQPQPGSAAGACRTLTVEVSYDNGRTWRKARLTGTGNNRVAHLRHPRGAGYVSLRAGATDAAGNTVRQTVLRAYRLRP